MTAVQTNSFVEVSKEDKVNRLYPVKSALMTRKEIAGVLGITVQTVTKRANLGLIKKVCRGGEVRYPADLNKLTDYIFVKER